MTHLSSTKGYRQSQVQQGGKAGGLIQGDSKKAEGLIQHH
jgi:hypothetical protein